MESARSGGCARCDRVVVRYFFLHGRRRIRESKRHWNRPAHALVSAIWIGQLHWDRLARRSGGPPANARMEERSFQQAMVSRRYVLYRNRAVLGASDANTDGARNRRGRQRREALHADLAREQGAGGCNSAPARCW